jgi:hypothetical protein
MQQGQLSIDGGLGRPVAHALLYVSCNLVCSEKRRSHPGETILQVDVPNALGPLNGLTLDAVVLEQIVIELIDGKTQSRWDSGGLAVGGSPRPLGSLSGDGA